MSISLPKAGATAGQVLTHAVNTFERVHKPQYPCTFKFGITHDPCFRWNHHPYGYRYGRERFEHMIVIFASSNPHGPAFLEAALIRQFGSCSALQGSRRRDGITSTDGFCWHRNLKFLMHFEWKHGLVYSALCHPRLERLQKYFERWGLMWEGL